MYSVNSWKLANIRSFEQAKNYWEKTKPWRGKDPNVRPAGTRRQVYTTIRKEGDDYVIRYHKTDVVRFHPNGSMTFQAYSSLSTNNIVRRFTPSGMVFDYTSYGFFVGTLNTAGNGWRMQKVDQVFKLHPQTDGSWMIEGTLPMIQTIVDKKAANKVYKDEGYKDFAAFMRAAEKLNPPEDLPHWKRYTQHWTAHMGEWELISQFQCGLEGWSAIVDKLPCPTQALAVVREHLIRKHACTKKVEVECTTWTNLRNVAKSESKWR